LTRKSGIPTIHDVARRARVSVMTVSRSLNTPEKVSARTAARIKSVMEQLGYQPSHVARSLVKRRTHTIGIIMPDIKNTFFNSWYRSVDDCARRMGYTTLLCNTDENSDSEIKFVKSFQSQRVDGILIVPHSEEAVKYLVRGGMKFVLVDRVYHDIESDFIVTDHYDGAFHLTDYLINLGHRRIGVLKGPGVLFPDNERYRGFIDAVKRNGSKVATDLVRNCEFREAEAFVAVKEMMVRKDHPTALFPFNSLMTIGAIKAIQEMNLKIPDDVSLACYDEIPGYDIFEPKITHVLQPIQELGQRAAMALINKLEKPDHKEKYQLFLKPKLVIGNSCMSLVPGG